MTARPSNALVRRWFWRIAGCALVGLTGCASTPGPSPAETLALRHERQGAAAFDRGDLDSARRDYHQALALHDALGNVPARASVVLSLARIAAQAGRADEARALVDQALGDAAALPTPLRVSAHGRAAALALARDEPSQAMGHLDQADRLCAPPCADAGALTVLRARVALQQQQAARAIELANAALALPGLRVAAPPERPDRRAGTERANALRLRARAELSLGRASEAAASAAAAFALDQALGHVDRVGADLQLLATAHEQLGNGEMAGNYLRLAERARQARDQLRGAGAAP